MTAFDNPESPSAWFKVDDGSKVNVKVAVPSGVTINKNWQYVIVTGVVSCEKIGSDLLPVIKVRKPDDIVPMITGP